MVSEAVEKNNLNLDQNSNGFIDLIENTLGIDQKFILKALNVTCLILSLLSLSMSYIAYRYNELLHMKLLLVLAIMLVIFSGIVYWYIPKFDEFLAESSRIRQKTPPHEGSKKDD